MTPHLILHTLSKHNKSAENSQPWNVVLPKAGAPARQT